MITKKNLKIENEELKAVLKNLEEKNDYLSDNNDILKRDSAELCNRLNTLGVHLEKLEQDIALKEEKIESLENKIKELTKYKNMYDAEENIAKDIVSSVHKNSDALGIPLNNLFNGDVLDFLDRVVNSYKK